MLESYARIEHPNRVYLVSVASQQVVVRITWVWDITMHLFLSEGSWHLLSDLSNKIVSSRYIPATMKHDTSFVFHINRLVSNFCTGSRRHQSERNSGDCACLDQIFGQREVRHAFICGTSCPKIRLLEV